MKIGLEVFWGINWKVVDNLYSDLLHEGFQSDIEFDILLIVKAHYLARVYFSTCHIQRFDLSKILNA